MEIKQSEKTCILVLGMHRSGTSSFTRLLNILGAQLPDELIPPAPDNNKLGFWESKELMAIHNNILISADMSWYDIRPFPESFWHSSIAQDAKNKLTEFVINEFAESNLFVIKDPRICRFSPLWIDVLQKLNINPVTLIPFRNPLEVCASLELRNNMTSAYSQLLWLRHIIEAEQATRNIPRSFIRYEDLLSDWHKIEHKISKDLNITWPNRTDSVTTMVEQFLNKEHRHHVASDLHSDLNKWVRKTYRALMLFMRGDNDNAIKIINNIADKLNQADAIFSPLLVPRKINKGLIELSQHERTIQSDIKAQEKRPDNIDIKIYQIYFKQTQYQMLDSAFIPYDNSEASEACEYEFGVFKKNFDNKNYLASKYTGFMSWKFGEKTNITGIEFLTFIKNNPGYDVYFVNPHPEQLIHHKNVWLQGNHFHKGILQFTQKLMNKLDYGIDLKELINNTDTLLYCNYWVGNEKFWNSYMNFVTPIYNYLKNDISPEEFEFLNQNATIKRDINYFPFIFERLFSTLITTNPDNVRYLSLNKYLTQKGEYEPPI